MKELTESSHACSYTPPIIEVIEFKNENGFAFSGSGENAGKEEW